MTRSGAAAATESFTPDNCWRLHRLYIGDACSICTTRIPAGPYSNGELLRLFHGDQVFIGARRATDPDPAEAANPPSQELLAAEADLGYARQALELAKLEWQRVVREGPFPGQRTLARVLGPFAFVMPDPVNAKAASADEERERGARRRTALQAYDRRCTEAHDAYKLAYDAVARALRAHNELQGRRQMSLNAWRRVHPGAV